MPTLKKARREAFARNIIASARTGASQAECYEAAGYKTTGNASESAASRLLSSVQIRSRIDELSRPAVRKMAFTLESLSDEVQKTIESAREKGQNSVVLKGVELGARLHGLLRERVDITHEIGIDRESILARIGEKYGQEAASVLREMIGAPPPIEVKFDRIATKPDVERRVDETNPELLGNLPRDGVGKSD
jgi:hypothetical protein